MNEKLRKDLDEQLAYLAPINQQAIQSFDWATELVAIGKQYGLHIDEIEELQHETMMVLVGLVHGQDFTDHIITKLALAPTEATKIVEQVNERIFGPIHEFIVRGGPEKKELSETAIMENAGFQMIQKQEPIIPEPVSTPIQPIEATPISPILETPPYESIPVTQNSPISPLTFNPQNTGPTPLDTIPVTQTPIKEPLVMSSREKLEKFYQQRKQIIDASIQSMDQQKPPV